jgi:pimeloyl-ACP methyl ester carboxylesterase/CRP-like cAMP-binding protein
MPITTVNGYRHFYEDVGSGEPVILLHGVMNSSRYFDKLIPDLATDFRVIAPHLRGMGFSEHVAQLPPTAWASDVIALMDDLGLDDAHVYGVSLGGIIAMRLAIEFPDRVRTLTVDSPIIALKAIPSLRESRVRKEPPPNVVDELRAMHGDDWLTVQENCDRYLQTPEMWHYLNLGPTVAAITAPALIIRGDTDEPFHPFVHAIDLHEALSGSWLWIAPRTRSLLARRHPADSLRVFRDFLSEHNPPVRHDPATRRHVELLAAIDIFTGLGDDALSRLAAGAQVLTSHVGDIVFRQGDPADGLYVVGRGAFAVSISLQTGRGDVRLRTLRPGDFFGEMALLTNKPRSATVRCERDGELLRIDRTHVRALLCRDPAAATAVATTLTGYLQAHNRELAGGPSSISRRGDLTATA